MNQIDYSKYSLAELEDVKRNIDKSAYPDRYQKVIKEIAKRRQENTSDIEGSNTASSTQTEKDFINAYWDPKTANKDLKNVLWAKLVLIAAIASGILFIPIYLDSYIFYHEMKSILINSCFAIAFASLVLARLFFLTPKRIVLNEKVRTRFKLNSITKEHRYRLIVSSLISIMFGVLVYLGAYNLGPAIAHQYFLEAKEATMIVTVDRRRFSYRSKYCRGKIYLDDAEMFQNAHLCRVFNRDAWNNIESGDTLKLYGTESILGFNVSSAKKLSR